ncbi:chloride channel protein [Faecalimicrobium sp. JNUCC 81]
MIDIKNSTFNILNKVKNLKYRIVIDSLIVGMLVGLVIVLNRFLASELGKLFMNMYKFAKSHVYSIPFVFLILAILGYFVAKLSKKEPMISGSGIPQVEGTLIRKLNMNWLRVLMYKFIGGVACLGVGLSVGREGPSVQMGACIGQGVSSKLNKLDYEEKYLITSGASAGLSAAFNAPLSGVMFALEEAHKNFSPLVLLSAMVASLSADIISKGFFGIIPSLEFSKLAIMPLKYYWVLIFLGVMVGISGVIFNTGILKTQSIFKNSKMKIEYKIIIPFLLAGLIGIISPILLGGGHELIMSLKGMNFTITTLLIFLFVKFIFTFISFGSGVPGGIFFPLLVLGALVGNIVGLIGVNYLGIPNEYLINFVVLAMAGHFAASVKAPITGILLISEMTGTFEHLLPLAIVVIIAQLTSDLLNANPIYEELLDRILHKQDKCNTEISTNSKTLLEIGIELDSCIEGKYIKEINWPKNALVVSITRGNKEILPKGNTKIHVGDYMVVMTDESTSSEVLEEISKLSKNSKTENS